MMTKADQVRNFLNEYRKRYPFSGTALVAQQGNVLFEASYGFANEEFKVPFSSDTKFGIWSITKSFTAMAIHMLAEQRLLHLNNPVSDYLPEMKRLDAITISQLLQHRSGLPNFTNLPEYNANKNKWPLSRQDWLELLADKPLDFSPGADFSYNNTGYYLLGIIIEIVSGETYERFIASRILQPLGMANTGMNNGRVVIPGLATPYHASGFSVAPAEFIDMSTVFSAGCMYSTARDLLKWDQALYSDLLVSQASFDETFGSEEANYGLGWFLDRLHGKKRIYHGGAYRGYRSELHRFPDEGFTIILLTNYDFVPVTKLANRLCDLMLGKDAPLPEMPGAFPLTDADFERLRGTYEGFGCKAVVDCDEAGVYFLWNNRERNPLYPISETSFQHAWLDASYTFKQKQGGWTFLGMSKVE